VSQNPPFIYYSDYIHTTYIHIHYPLAPRVRGKHVVNPINAARPAPFMVLAWVRLDNEANIKTWKSEVSSTGRWMLRGDQPNWQPLTVL
jgi:hypothetical protein